jgi:signal transduction histidine kinase
MGAFDLLAGLTSRVASTARLDELVEHAFREIGALGFGMAWIGLVDEQTGVLATFKATRDGGDATDETPRQIQLDVRQPIGHSFRERRMINIADPDALIVLERHDDAVPAGMLALARASYERVRGHPFACGPLLGSNGEPVGALGLGSYHGRQPIPDDVLAHGLVPSIIDVLTIAIERARHGARIARLTAQLGTAQTTLAEDAGIKAVGELAALTAHDINNMLTSTQMHTTQGARSPAEATDALPKIELISRAIAALVARLQRIARLPSSQSETANLTQIVDDILAMVQPSLRERSIAVDVALPAVLQVRCDAAVVLQVVLNLMVNAGDALDDVPIDRRQIQIRAHQDGSVVRLTVADTGPGIAPEVMARLFQPFFTTKPVGHLGLGLAGSHAALAQAGGKLSGRNAPTGGAVFELTLVAVPAGAPEAPLPSRSGTAAPTRGARILVVDDDPDVVDIISAYLQPFGYDVVTSLTSAQALEVAGQRTFDLVLCDFGMPKQNGLDVAIALRRSGYRSKIVLMTGWDAPTLSTEALRAVCDLLLKKPFVGGELIQAIESLLAP